MLSCLERKLFHFDSGARDYSEYTGGSDPRMSCDATPSHWDLNMLDDSERAVRRKLLSAETCKDFVQHE